jgi:hypothetical protein
VDDDSDGEFQYEEVTVDTDSDNEDENLESVLKSVAHKKGTTNKQTNE